MSEWIAANWILVAIGLAVLVLIVGWLVLASRRTTVERVQTSEEPAPAQRNQALIDAPPAASAASPGPMSGAANSQKVAAAPAIADAEAGPTPAPTAPPSAASPAPSSPTPSSPTPSSPAPASPAAVSPAASAESDIARLKGVGPKLVAQLADLGVTSVAQIAAWDDADIDRIDAQLGRFSGRIRRDAWVEQARLLESGDTAAYESRFGKG
ncbi:hypothetical protein [Aurantiacibacter suaedae]|uniref:hypothetical protein n=1 Tax=Aurantiacibacter suaedae TaxID=2545755 RepID=UPI0013A549A3|nr:hypothetical protein [Aurantiacibacter suaedae]